MAIDLVGTPRIASVGNGNGLTLTFDAPLAAGDVVYVFGGIAIGKDVPLGPSTPGYTPIHTRRNLPSVTSVLARKVMAGATADTSVTCLGSGSGQDAVAYCSFALRGVDPESPEDAAVVEFGPESQIHANCSPVQVVTPDSMVVIFAIGGPASNGAFVAAPANYSNFVQVSQVDTNRVFLGAASRVVAAPGIEDPAPFTNEGTEQVWFGLTLAVKPEGDVPPPEPGESRGRLGIGYGIGLQ